MNKQITFAETSNIEDYEAIARKFLNDILDINYDECFISDESWLSDFSSCGLPEDFNSDGMSLEELYNEWDKYIVIKIKEAYGIELDMSKKVVLVELFEQIRQDSLKLRS